MINLGNEHRSHTAEKKKSVLGNNSFEKKIFWSQQIKKQLSQYNVVTRTAKVHDVLMGYKVFAMYKE